MATATNPASLLGAVLPDGWALVPASPRAGDRDRFVDLISPGGTTARLLLLGRSKVWPRDVPGLRARVSDVSGDLGVVACVVVAPWLSPQTRGVLARAGLSYADSQGSLHLVLREPETYVHLEGSDRNPAPEPHALRSLKGRGSGRALRALLDFALPERGVGVRELAKASGASAASLSRVVTFLATDDLVRRDDRGGVLEVDLPGVLRRWALDYPTPAGGAMPFLEPRGLAALRIKLVGASRRYVATGASALEARARGMVAPVANASLWVDDPAEFAHELGLVEATRGGNVVLRRAWDDVVFERPWGNLGEANGLVVAALPQVAVDLLVGPGREPAQGEELLAQLTVEAAQDGASVGPAWEWPWPAAEDGRD